MRRGRHHFARTIGELGAEYAIEKTCDPQAKVEPPTHMIDLRYGIKCARGMLKLQPPPEIRARLVEWINQANALLLEYR